MSDSDRLYFRQLLSGRDFAVGDMMAQQMRNFAYLIGDRETGECVVVDPAYAANDLVDAAEADGMRLTGVLVSHHHPDHVGGSMMGFTLKGVAELLERAEVPVHVNTHEADWVSRVTGIPLSDLTAHDHGDKVTVGAVEIELLHTPGHTPGSQCFLLDGRLVAGDTLFLEGCGRTDFPGGNVDDMFHSLQALAKLPGDPTVYPGHWYAAEPSASLSEVRRTNYVYRASNLEQWRMLMGA
ncbi:MBL fold metallo-hydrolase [Mycolicibacterium thermoresistibile]